MEELMLSFFGKNAMDKFYRPLVLFLTALLFCVTACSSSDDDEPNYPRSAPNNMALTAKSGYLHVQFSKVLGIGGEGSQNNPSYEVSIGTNEDGSDKAWVGTVPTPTARLVSFEIVKGGTPSDTVFVYPDMQDGETYWIFVRTDFGSYGYSDYAKLSAVPIPLPTPIDNFNLVAGDKQIIITWTAKDYEEYGVGIDGQCPRNSNQMTNTINDPNWWKVIDRALGNNHVFKLDDNAASHSICMTSTNTNGNAPWVVHGTIDTTAKTITYTPVYGQPATATAAAPEITKAKNANKRVDISFPAVLTGAGSVSEYEYGYKESGSSDAWSWGSILITSVTGYNAADGTGTANASIANLVNGKTYEIRVRATNSVSTGVEGPIVTGSPVYIELNFNNPDEYLSKANSEYIYAENVPHSDFWRISKRDVRGGRSDSDRLVRGKETALGNLYADAVQWFAKEKGYDPDFTWLIGDMINNGIQSNRTITPRFLKGITNQDFIDDTVVIVTLKGSDLIKELDYNLDLEKYPAVGTNNGYAATLFGQAAAVYRNGHYGGSGDTVYNGVYWGMPSAEVRYTIEYTPYSLDAFNTHFNGIPACVAARDARNGDYGSVEGNDNPTDSDRDPLGCYPMPYSKASPYSGNPGDGSDIGYKRGKIKRDSLTIGGVPIDPNKTYKIVTTKRVADSHYVAFLNGTVTDAGVTLVRAVAEYIYNNGSAGIDPKLDGRVKLEGGVPGAND
jgi:hypothetical protein